MSVRARLSWGVLLALTFLAGYALPDPTAAAAQSYVAPYTAPVCVYSSPTPTPAANTELPLQCNSTGQLITSGSGGGGGFPTVSKYTYTANTSSVQTAKASAGSLCGVVNNSATAQGVTLTIYDNASSASGTVLYSGAPLGAGQAVIFAPFCIPAANGITAQATGSTNADFGIVLVYE